MINDKKVAIKTPLDANEINNIKMNILAINTIIFKVITFRGSKPSRGLCFYVRLGDKSESV